MTSHLWLLAAAALVSSAAAQSDLFVDAASSGGNGSSQAPFTTIQEAVDVAAPGSTIRVAAGAYEPFDADVHVSVLGAVGGGTRVVFGATSDRQARIEAGDFNEVQLARLTFDGLGDGVNEVALDLRGESSFLIEDCEFVGLGSAILLSGISGALIRRCNVSNSGSAVYCADIDVAIGGVGIEDCTFVENGSPSGSPLLLIFKDGGFSEVKNCTFERNVGTLLHADNIPALLMSECVIRDTVLPGSAAAIRSNFFAAEVERCLITGPADGAALPLSSAPFFERTSKVFECRIQGQPTGHRGPLAENTPLRETIVTGVDAGTSPLISGGELINCTLSGNRTAAPGALVDGAEVTNTILALHDGPVLAGGADANFSLVQGGAPGSGNLSGDPRFVGPLAGNFELRPDSPCIGAGDPNLPDPSGATLDIGAVPFRLPFAPRSGTFCEGLPTAAGCVPTISGSARASVAPGATTQLSAAQLPASSFGLFFLSPNGNAQLPAGQLLCVGSPSRRSDVVAVTGFGACGGTAALALTGDDLVALGFGSGDHLYAQFIARDSANPNGLGITLTPGLEMIVD